MGIVEKDKIINGAEITKGDKIIGLPSSGPHSNGFSLIRKILELKEIESSELIDEMMNPTKIYVRSVLALLQKIKVKGMVHITGGGFYENIEESYPANIYQQTLISQLGRDLKFLNGFKMQDASMNARC